MAGSFLDSKSWWSWSWKPESTYLNVINKNNYSQEVSVLDTQQFWPQHIPRENQEDCLHARKTITRLETTDPPPFPSDDFRGAVSTWHTNWSGLHRLKAHYWMTFSTLGTLQRRALDSCPFPGKPGCGMLWETAEALHAIVKISVAVSQWEAEARLCVPFPLSALENHALSLIASKQINPSLAPKRVHFE